MTNSNKKINATLVLSGGGGLGVAHIGALKVLEKQYNFNYYTGVSAGAIVAAAHAVGYSAEEISKIVLEQNFFKLAFDFAPSKFGILHGNKVEKLLEEIFQNKTFEDLKAQNITLKIGTTDFNTGQQVILDSGSISKAVRASLSVPVLFTPIFHQDKWLVDGGLSQNFPVNIAQQETINNKIIAIDVATAINQKEDYHEKKFFGKFAGIQNTLEQTFRIFFKNQETFDKNDPRLTIYRPNLAQFKTIDIFKLKEIEKIGENTVK